VRERFAGDVLEREVRPAIVLADRVEGHDVRVVEARGRAGLLEETLDAMDLHDRALDELQRDPAAERDVLREVDLAHRPLAEEAADPEVTDPRVFGEQRIWPIRMISHVSINDLPVIAGVKLRDVKSCYRFQTS
jgi:hypothetical protein